MPNLAKLDNMYMDIAARVAAMSYARRAKVGAVLAHNNNIISYGWNGSPSGQDNNCENEINGVLSTKPEVLHAESNVLMKLVASGGTGSSGSTLYVTLSPCFECAKLIKQAKISRVVYRDQYRDSSGIDFLTSLGVVVEKIKGEN